MHPAHVCVETAEFTEDTGTLLTLEHGRVGVLWGTVHSLQTEQEKRYTLYLPIRTSGHSLFPKREEC